MQTEARTSSKRKPARPAQRDRQRAAQGKHDQPRGARHRNARPGENGAAMRDSVPSALKMSLRNRNGVYVDLVTLPKGTCLLDTEQKLLQAMEDLLPVVSSFKEFKDNTRWSLNSSTPDVFHSLYIKLLQLIKVGYGRIIWKDGAYRLMVKQPVYFDVTCPVMPVYFIPTLEKQNKELFDLCFYLVILLHKQADVRLWDEDNEGYVFENLQQWLAHYKTNRSADADQVDIKPHEQAYEEHKEGGVATVFCDRLFKTGASKKAWIKRFKEFKPNTKLKKDLHRWLHLGYELLLSGDSMVRYISVPPELEQEMEENETVPALPDERVKFLWKTHDEWWETFAGYAESQDQNEGSLPFYRTGLIEKASQVEDTKNCFPAQLLRFMKAGRELEKRYRSVFANPEKLKKALQPKPTYLIDIL